MKASASEADVMNGLFILRTRIAHLVNQRLPEAKVTEFARLTGPEMGLVQTDPTHPLFGFCRQAGRPIGVRAQAPLGSLPEVGVAFTIRLPSDFEIVLGVCRYAPTTPIELDWASEKSERKYDGHWFFYNYCDPMSGLNRNSARTFLEIARQTGFEISIKDENQSPFDELLAV